LGALLFVWMVASVAWPIAIAAGVAVMLFTGLGVAACGPGQRWRRYKLQRFPEKNQRDLAPRRSVLTWQARGARFEAICARATSCPSGRRIGGIAQLGRVH
jgi:hypothetical protein